MKDLPIVLTRLHTEDYLGAYALMAPALAMRRIADRIPDSAKVAEARRELSAMNWLSCPPEIRQEIEVAALQESADPLERALAIFFHRMLTAKDLIFTDDHTGLATAVQAIMDAGAMLLPLLAHNKEKMNRHQRRADGKRGGKKKSEKYAALKAEVIREAAIIRDGRQKEISDLELGKRLATRFGSNPLLKAMVDSAAMSWERFPATAVGWLKPEKSID